MQTALEPIGKSIVAPTGCAFTETGIAWTAKPTEETLNELDRLLQRCERSSAWWEGDFLCARIDEDLKREAEFLKIQFETPDSRKGRLRDAVRRHAQARDKEAGTSLMYIGVANLFPPEKRFADLKHAHHRICWEQGLTLPPSLKWLERARAGHWPASKLRAEVQAEREAKQSRHEPSAGDDLPRELSAMESWSATRWLELQAIEHDEAERMLAEIPTTVRVIDLLRERANVKNVNNL